MRHAPFANPPLEQAAQLRVEQACYGEAQLAAVGENLPQVARALESIAVLEEQVTAALEQGLRKL